MRIQTATISWPIGTCAIRIRSSVRCPNCRGCIRSTSATMTIATSSCPHRRRRRTSIGSPTPMRIPLVLARQIPSGDLALPIAPQEWHFKQSIDYSVSLDRPVLDYASRRRENLLFNIYKMGRSSIERATKDFSVAGKQYPVGSYVVHTAQAFRPLVMDMFEPQVHPDVFPFPGSPPTPPYVDGAIPGASTGRRGGGRAAADDSVIWRASSSAPPPVRPSRRPAEAPPFSPSGDWRCASGSTLGPSPAPHPPARVAAGAPSPCRDPPRPAPA